MGNDPLTTGEREMTRRDFELIADVLRERLEAEKAQLNVPAILALARTARRFAAILGQTNSGFLPERFLKRCGVGSEELPCAE
jgi:hypothetical protein